MEASLIIGAVIIALTQAIKYLSDKVKGLITMVVAVLLGILIAVVDTSIGVKDISIAQGVVIALAAIGAHTTINK